MSASNNPPRPTEPIHPPNPDCQDEPRLEGTLTAEDIEEMRREGITFGDLIRDLEAMD